MKELQALSGEEFEACLQETVDKIVKAFNPEKIILFGSTGRRETTPDSDVDLLIIMKSDERPAARATRVSSLFHPRPFPMDIIVRTPQEVQHRLDIGDHFMHEVTTEGRVLYGPGSSK